MTLVFDSLMTASNTDNFSGSQRILNLLNLAHSLIIKNANLRASLRKTKQFEVQEMITNQVQLGNVIKSTTVGWIVKLT
jgi:hypothetical protein